MSNNDTGNYVQNIGGARPTSAPAIDSWIKKKNFRTEAANTASKDSFRQLAIETQAQIDRLQALQKMLNSPEGQEILKQAKEVVAKTHVEHYENSLQDVINALNQAEEEAYVKIEPAVVDVLLAPPKGPVQLPSSPFSSLNASAMGPDVFVARITYCGFDKDRILVDKGLVQLYMTKLRELKEQGMYDPIIMHDIVLKNFKGLDGNIYPRLMNTRIFAYANQEAPGNDAYLYVKLHIPVGVVIPDSASVELYISHKI